VAILAPSQLAAASRFGNPAGNEFDIN